MEPTLRSFIFCDAVVPALEGKLICYGVFSDIFVQKFPLTYPQFCILTTWTKGEGFHIQQIKVLNPQRTMIMVQSPEMYFTLNDESETANVKTDVNQVVFSEPGTYFFQVYLDGEMIGEFPLHFRLKEIK
jgi:hypothetical protein